MKKLFLLLSVLGALFSCSSDKYDYNPVEAAKEEYEWLKLNIEGYWEEHPKPFEGLIEYGYAYFEVGFVDTYNIFGYDGVLPYKLKHEYGLNYLIVGDTEYRIIDVDEQDKIIVLRGAGNLKKVGD